MMMPTIQNCPVCGDKFMGSDAIGDPCPLCEAKKRGDRAVAYPVPCPMCQGNRGNERCPVCQGEGAIIGIRRTP